MGYLILAITF